MFGSMVPIICFWLILFFLCYFWVQVHRFNKKKKNMDFLKEIYGESEKGTFPYKSPKKMKKLLSEKNMAYLNQEEFIKRYEVLYAWVVSYCIVELVLACLWITYVVITIFVYKVSYSECGALFFIGCGILIFGMGMPPILKSYGGYKLKRTADLIDQLMHVFVNDKINSVIYETVVTCLLLIVNLFLFWLCLKIGTVAFNQYAIEDNLENNLIVLLVYQYGVIYLVARFLNYIYQKVVRKDKKFPDVNSRYIFTMLKDNTYLLFLIFYFAGKVLQCDLNSIDANLTIEAIGIIFLIDTYVDKRKNQKQGDISSI